MKRILTGITALLMSFGLMTGPALADMNKPVVTDIKPSGTVAPEYTPTEGDNDEVIFEIDGQEDGNSVTFDIKTEKAGSVVLKNLSVCKFLDSLKIKANKGIEAKIIFESRESNPTKVELEKSLGFCTIVAQNLNKSDIDLVEWNLKVNRKDLNDQNLKNELMSLVMFNNNKWNEVKTKKSDGNTESYTYVATSNTIESTDYSFAEFKSGLFTLTNILICLGSLFGLIVLGLIIAYATQSKDKKQSTKK